MNPSLRRASDDLRDGKHRSTRGRKATQIRSRNGCHCATPAKPTYPHRADSPTQKPATEDDLRAKVLARAVKILSARPRSETQLRERLRSDPHIGPRLVDDCLSRLKELGFINDNYFAQNYASYRVNVRPMGRSRLARELAGKKVKREAIKEALDSVFGQIDEEALIDRAIEKRIRTHGRPVDQRGVKRMFDHLARLGFEYDLIIRRVRALKASSRDAFDLE